MTTLRHILATLLTIGLMGFGAFGHAKHLSAKSWSTSLTFQSDSSPSLADGADLSLLPHRGHIIGQKCEEETPQQRTPDFSEVLVYINIIPRPAIEPKPDSVDEPVTPLMVIRFFAPSIPANAPPFPFV